MIVISENEWSNYVHTLILSYNIHIQPDSKRLTIDERLSLNVGVSDNT